MERIRGNTCSKCKKNREELYLVDSFWQAPVQVRSDGVQRTYTYIKNSEVKQQYAICTKCVERHVKTYKILRYLVGSFLTLFAVGAIGAMLEEIFEPGGSTEIPIILSLLFLFLTVGAISAFIRQDKEKLIMKSLDAIAINRLVRDIQSGKIAKKRKGNIRGVTVRSELTITKKSFRDMWDWLY